MKRARQDLRISNWMAVDAGVSPMHLAPYPPDPWYLRGPRGGIYIATGERRRISTQDDYESFMRNETLVTDVSEGALYLRPGTQAHREAVEALS